MPKLPRHLIRAENFCATVEANVDNDKLSDAEFRQFIRNTIQIVQFPSRKRAEAMDKKEN